MRAIAARSTIIQAVNYFGPAVVGIFSSLHQKGKLNDGIGRQSMKRWSRDCRRGSLRMNVETLLAPRGRRGEESCRRRFARGGLTLRLTPGLARPGLDGSFCHRAFLFNCWRLANVEPNTLGERKCSAVVDGVGGSPHIGFPRV